MEWRFTASNFKTKTGLSEAGSETFKKNEYMAFAREILQNSIDARLSDEEPVIVEFNSFNIETSKIPDKDGLLIAMKRSRECFKYKSEYVEKYNKMISMLEADTISCLRVSDKNTTGLIGMESIVDENNKFRAFVFGSGISEKSSEAALGSKGVGKFAAFNLSDIDTVFYSSVTNKNLDGTDGINKGYIGVAKLVSGYIKDYDENEEKKDYTTGTGFCCEGEFNSPCKDLISFEDGYIRDDNTPGTDIYILGFKPTIPNWKNDIINSILESFIFSIYRKKLIVYVDGIELSSDNLETIVFNDSIIDSTYKKSIVSQYLIAKEVEWVMPFDIDTLYGTATLYVLPMKGEYVNYATASCTMIRVPYMKIKNIPVGTGYLVSAVCIINDDQLGKTLRKIENAQHNDWEYKRIKDPSVRKEVCNVLTSIREQIRSNILTALRPSNQTEIDPLGAGDYLPENVDDNGSGENDGNQPDQNKKIDTMVNVTIPKEEKYISSKPVAQDDDSEAIEPDIGGVDPDQPGDVLAPKGPHNKTDGPNHPGTEPGQKTDGEDEIFRLAKLTGVKYKVMAVNKDEGLYRIIFISPETIGAVKLSFIILDDCNNGTKATILEMKLNGENVASSDNLRYGPFDIEEGKKYIVDLKLKEKGLFGSEVGIYYDCKK